LGRYLGDWQERRCQNRASEMPWFRQSDFPPFAGHTKLATDQFPIREKGHRSLFGSSAFPGDENPAALFLGSYPALRSRSATTSISARSLALTWNSLFLLAHLPRVLFLLQRDKPAVPQVAVRGPLDEFELRHEHRLEPAAFFHLLGRQALPPAPAPWLWQVGKGAFLDFQRMEPAI